MDVLSQEKSQLRLNLVLVARLAHFKQPSGNSGGSPLQPRRAETRSVSQY